jgi:hypothetical protein
MNRVNATLAFTTGLLVLGGCAKVAVRRKATCRGR